MSLFETILEWAHTGGSVVGGGSGIVGGYLYRRFLEVEKAVLGGKDRVGLVTVVFGSPDKPGILTQISNLRERIDKIVRGSKVDIHATLTEDDERRLEQLESGLLALRNELSKRITELEDDFDARNREDQKWNEDIKWTLGKIEGILETKSRG